MSTNFFIARRGILGLTRCHQSAQHHLLRLKSTTSAAPQRLQPETVSCDPPCGDQENLQSISSVGSEGSSTNNQSVKSPAVRRFEPLDPDPYFEKIDLSFSNTRECFRNKSTYELLRSIVVFQLCAIDFIVDNNKQLLNVGRRILGRTLFNKLMKATIYGQFVGGEDKKAIQGTISKNMAFGVKSILDYSAEEDMSSAKAKKLEMSSTAPMSRLRSLGRHRGAEAKFVPHEEFGDRREDVISARTFFYENEMSCDKNMGIFMDCIDAVKGTTGGTGLAAIKLTALGRPQLLINLSQVLIQNKRYYDEQTKLQKTNDGVFHELTDRSRSRRTQDSPKVKFNPSSSSEEGSVYIPVPVMEDDNVTVVAVNEEGQKSKDLLSWKSLRDINESLAPLFTVMNPNTGELEQLAEGLNREEERQMKRMIQRINTLVEYAEDRNVRVMIDAEQTYFQPAISRLATEMMKLFNKDKALVFNTYQCYLKEALNSVQADIKRAEKHGYYFACKLVRGAYMEQERKRADKLGYEDPINPDYEATNAMYNNVFEHVMSRVQERPLGMTSVMMASHNEDSVRFAVKKMHEMGLTPEDRVVCFGQLLGMCDQISFSLGAAGYSVYKYVPYGPVDEVVPYLSRRAQENRAVMAGADRERKLLKDEFKRRFAKRELFYKPTITV